MSAYSIVLKDTFMVSKVLAGHSTIAQYRSVALYLNLLFEEVGVSLGVLRPD